MRPGPPDRPLLYLLLGLTLALAAILPFLAFHLWNLLGADVYRDGPGRLKPLVPLLLVLGEMMLFLRFRSLLGRIRGI